MPKHYRPAGKKKEGNAAKYMTRTKAVHFLQISLPTFRKLCILKGIFPREPKKKVEGNHKTYYLTKDIMFLAHEPLLEKFRDIRAHKKKIKKARGKKNRDLAERLLNRQPRYTLDRLILERYPTFIDALRDLDDCLTMVHLFAALPATEGERVQVERIHNCRRLSHEWQAYISRTHSLRKTFISVKGIYYQAVVDGQKITWLTPQTPPPMNTDSVLTRRTPPMLLVLSLSLLFLLSPTAALYSPSSPVLQLSPANFKSKVLESNRVVLVEFFAPWCGHCKALTPTWEKAATVLKGVATVAALDADAHQALAQEYGIKGFPTIKVFTPGKPPVDYQGAREVKPIAEYALQQIKVLLKERLNGKPSGSSGSSGEKKETSASVELTSSNFDELVLKSKDLWVVEFFAPWCGHCKKLAPEWKKASINLKGKVKLGHVDCDAEKSLMSRFNVQGFPTILVFGADKDSPMPYEGARTASAIESFALVMLETNIPTPEVSELTDQAVMEDKCASAPICFVAFLPDILDSKAEGRNKYLDMLMSVAEKFKRSPYSYVWAAAGKQADLENQVGVGGYGYPALVALNVKKGAYAPLRSAFELDQITEFVKEASRGGKGNLPLSSVPTIAETEPWDGKDGEVLEEDEFSLEELMGEDTAGKDEL